jgi:hypothetical protein
MRDSVRGFYPPPKGCVKAVTTEVSPGTQVSDFDKAGVDATIGDNQRRESNRSTYGLALL